MEPRLLQRLEREWHVSSRGDAASLVHSTLVGAEPGLAALDTADLATLFLALRRVPDGCCVKSWEVATALVRQAGLHHLVILGLLDALRPGLAALGRRLDWGRDGPWRDADAFVTDLLSITWQVLRQLEGRTLGYPFPTVLRCVRRRLLDEVAATRRRAAREVVFDISGDRSPIGDPSDPRPVSVLGQLATALAAAAGSQLAPDEARLLFRHRVLGYSLEELAATSGAGSGALRVRRRRAEAKLGAR